AGPSAGLRGNRADYGPQCAAGFRLWADASDCQRQGGPRSSLDKRTPRDGIGEEEPCRAEETTVLQGPACLTEKTTEGGSHPLPSGHRTTAAPNELLLQDVIARAACGSSHRLLLLGHGHGREQGTRGPQIRGRRVRGIARDE